MGRSLPEPIAENGPLAELVGGGCQQPPGLARRQAQPDPVGDYHAHAGGAGAFRASAYQMLFSFFVLRRVRFLPSFGL
jgi:hypothetical protein